MCSSRVFYEFHRARRGNIEMVKWIGNFSLILKRLKDSWMDMLPMSTLSKEQRQNQYLADVAQVNADRQTRNVELLTPQATRDRWNATQVSNCERLLPFSDDMTTLMFIVASDLSTAQRERLTSSLSLRGTNVTTYTLFCAPKSSMKNPSLRVSGTRQQHEQNLHRGRLC